MISRAPGAPGQDPSLPRPTHQGGGAGVLGLCTPAKTPITNIQLCQQLCHKTSIPALVLASTSSMKPQGSPSPAVIPRQPCLSSLTSPSQSAENFPLWPQTSQPVIRKIPDSPNLCLEDFFFFFFLVSTETCLSVYFFFLRSCNQSKGAGGVFLCSSLLLPEPSLSSS